MTIKPTFKQILAERQEYLDTLKSTLPYNDLYALGFIETNFLYQMDDSGLAPLTTTQHATLAKWKAKTQ